MKISTRYKKTLEHLQAIEKLWSLAVIEQDVEIHFQKQIIRDILEMIGKKAYALGLFVDMNKNEDNTVKEKQQLLNEGE